MASLKKPACREVKIRKALFSQGSNPQTSSLLYFPRALSQLSFKPERGACRSARDRAAARLALRRASQLAEGADREATAPTQPGQWRAPLPTPGSLGTSGVREGQGQWELVWSLHTSSPESTSPALGRMAKVKCDYLRQRGGSRGYLPGKIQGSQTTTPW